MTTQAITTLILGKAPENAAPATHILAGPWCTAPASAEETGFDMPPEPLADPERLETAARQARQLVTQLAPRFRDYLNGLYGTQHDDRYWDFVLAPWLVRAVETLIDRLYPCWTLRHSPLRTRRTSSWAASSILSGTTGCFPAC